MRLWQPCFTSHEGLDIKEAILPLWLKSQGPDMKIHCWINSPQLSRRHRLWTHRSGTAERENYVGRRGSEKERDEQHIITIPDVGWVVNESLYLTACRISFNTTLCSYRDSQREVFLMVPSTLHFFLIVVVVVDQQKASQTWMRTHVNTFERKVWVWHLSHPRNVLIYIQYKQPSTGKFF